MYILCCPWIQFLFSLLWPNTRRQLKGGVTSVPVSFVMGEVWLLLLHVWWLVRMAWCLGRSGNSWCRALLSCDLYLCPTALHVREPPCPRDTWVSQAWDQCSNAWPSRMLYFHTITTSNCHWHIEVWEQMCEEHSYAVHMLRRGDCQVASVRTLYSWH